VSWNTGVNYFKDFARSANHREVIALYKAAGLSLHKDLETLNNAPRVSPDRKAVQYLIHNIVFDGKLTMPVLTLHTTGDGLVVPENEQAYRSVVRKAADSALLRQVFVHRAGHCAFTPAETITVVRALLHRLSTGKWNRAGLRPAALNRKAAALGPAYNIFENSKGKTVATAPQFIHYRPAPYLRPFDKGSKIPG
jgi:hypothetical protein